MEYKLVSATSVRNDLGGISDMTLWRWLNNPALNFPKPIYITRRRYWRDVEIIAWLDLKAEVAS